MSSAKPHLPSRRGVRVVGKIRPFLASEISSSDHPWISLTRSDEDHALLTFSDPSCGRKECHKLDWCYTQDEGVGEIFAREVKPLIQDIFRGNNACVIAYGARASGKTQVIQGSEDSPGLALLAVSEILLFAEEMAGSVSISCYEMIQDKVYDVLGLKEQEVFVLEDAGRRIQLKGLSQVPVKSMSDFNKIFFNVPTQRKPSQKAVDDSTIRSHRGLIVYVSFLDKESNHSLVGRINFVDLAGYEDTKQKSNARPQITENAKVNKSLYALLNVLYAQNANEAYVPYRESKLTRLLQDFICGTNGAVLITCLKPITCQDTIHAAVLASRSSQVVNRHRHDSVKKIKSDLRFVASSSLSNGAPTSSDNSVKKREVSLSVSVEERGKGASSMTKGSSRPQTTLTSAKKPGMSKVALLEKKANITPIATKGRKLFSGISPATKSLKENLLVSPVIEPLVTGLTENIESSLTEKPSVREEGNSLSSMPDGLASPKLEADVSPRSEQRVLQDSDIGNEFDAKLIIHAHDSNTQEGSETPLVNLVARSPPLSEQLREISNTLKLVSSQPLTIQTPKSVEVSRTRQESQDDVDVTDPKTPRISYFLSLDDNKRSLNNYTPQALLKTRSTGLKKSLVQECLAFLNCANKEELKELKGIGEKRATYILELREDNPEPFKDIDDIHEQLGLSSKQIKEMMTRILGEF